MISTGIHGFFFREGQHRDQVAAKSLIFSILKEYGLQPDTRETDADLEDIESAYSGGFFGLLYSENQELVGTFGLMKMGEDLAEIRKMYLVPEVRGNGLGKWMLEFLIQKAKDLNFRKMQLETASVLKEAINLYESRGFIARNPERLSPRCDRMYEMDI